MEPILYRFISKNDAGLELNLQNIKITPLNKNNLEYIHLNNILHINYSIEFLYNTIKMLKNDGILSIIMPYNNKIIPNLTVLNTGFNDVLNLFLIKNKNISKIQLTELYSSELRYSSEIIHISKWKYYLNERFNKFNTKS